MPKILRSRALRAIAAVVALMVVTPSVRKAVRGAPPRPDAETFAQAQRVTIVRDSWGVPHIFGKSDADASFGLAYANAEDDWPTVQGVIAASNGHLGLLLREKRALANDYYVSLVRVRREVEESWEALSPGYRAVLDGYARGLNLYAYLHPTESETRLFPLTGKDVAAGFAHKVPLMFDLPQVLEALGKGPKHVGDRVLAQTETLDREPRYMPGSNAHAVSASRAPDGVTRLNVNSHQPWSGPVTWYEAHVVSEEGWNMTGSLFPGAPIVLHGHNEHLGWAHTVNAPDLIDVYELVTDEKDPDSYRFEGERKTLEKFEAPITVDAFLFDLTLHKTTYWAPDIGPVFKTDHGTYAIRYAGMGRAVMAGEEWYRMNKAKSFDEWKAAMRLQAIPMFNTVYADEANIEYVYNASLPVRSGNWDYRTVLPGDKREAVWTEYIPWDSLPHVENPASGFVQTCNATPFMTTTGEGNPKAQDFDAKSGIETTQTNRSLRSLALLGGTAPIGREQFLAMKWDRTYDRAGAMFTEVVTPILAAEGAFSPDEAKAVELLRSWNGEAREDSVAATIAILTYRRVKPRGSATPPEAPVAALKATVAWLKQFHGKFEIPLGDVQRIRHGNVDLPIGGGPDVINAVAAEDDGAGHIVGFQGDSYILEVEFGKGPPRSTSVHQYGASVRYGSPHYTDQMKPFTAHELKPTWRDPAELAKHTERSYHPGER